MFVLGDVREDAKDVKEPVLMAVETLVAVSVMVLATIHVRMDAITHAWEIVREIAWEVASPLVKEDVKNPV